MRKKGSWFSAVKKALSPGRKEKKDQGAHKSKKKWFGKNKSSSRVSLSEETTIVGASVPPRTLEDAKLTEAENEQSKHVYSVALATAKAAEAAVAAAQAAAEVVRLTAAARYSGKSREEIAAIKIQTAFRGHMARRALRALRGLVRLKSLIEGHSVKRQATSTLKCMQTLARVQSQIHARRIRMSEENQALQRQLQLKHVKELEKLNASVGEEWDDRTQSKEQIEAKIQKKQEAAIRRERALAYAFSHQQTWKNSLKAANPTFMDPNNPRWGWSWLERWMAARPWETRTTADNNDHGSVTSTASRAMSVGGISRTHSRRNSFNHDNKPSPTTARNSSQPSSRHSPSTPPPKAPSTTTSIMGKTKLQSPRGSLLGGDDDSRSMLSARSEQCRRHSIGGSSVGDDKSNASSPSVPSYMAPTQSARAKSRLPSPLGLEKNATLGKESAGSAKKRLSFQTSPAGSRRHSGPPRVGTSSVKDIVAQIEEKVSNKEAGSTKENQERKKI